MEELKLKEIQVRNNAIITTAERYPKSDIVKVQNDIKRGKLVTLEEHNNLHKLVQRVVNIGPNVRDIQVGDWVFLNPLYYLDRSVTEQQNSIQADIGEKHMKEHYGPKYTFPTIELNGVEHLMLFDRDVEYIILKATEGDKEYISRQ